MPAYAILLYENLDRPNSDVRPGELAEHERHADELVAEGAMEVCVALADRDVSTSIRGDLVTDGPFLETKESLVGLYVTEAADLDEALSRARRNPILHQGGGIEVRPVEGFLIPKLP
jgi:hypothetical protein